MDVNDLQLFLVLFFRVRPLSPSQDMARDRLVLEEGLVQQQVLDFRTGGLKIDREESEDLPGSLACLPRRDQVEVFPFCCQKERGRSIS